MGPPVSEKGFPELFSRPAAPSDRPARTIPVSVIAGSPSRAFGDDRASGVAAQSGNGAHAAQAIPVIARGAHYTAFVKRINWKTTGKGSRGTSSGCKLPISSISRFFHHKAQSDRRETVFKIRFFLSLSPHGRTSVAARALGAFAGESRGLGFECGSLLFHHPLLCFHRFFLIHVAIRSLAGNRAFIMACTRERATGVCPWPLFSPLVVLSVS